MFSLTRGNKDDLVGKVIVYGPLFRKNSHQGFVGIFGTTNKDDINDFYFKSNNMDNVQDHIFDSGLRVPYFTWFSDSAEDRIPLHLGDVILASPFFDLEPEKIPDFNHRITQDILYELYSEYSNIFAQQALRTQVDSYKNYIDSEDPVPSLKNVLSTNYINPIIEAINNKDKELQRIGENKIREFFAGAGLDKLVNSLIKSIHINPNDIENTEDQMLIMVHFVNQLVYACTEHYEEAANDRDIIKLKKANIRNRRKKIKHQTETIDDWPTKERISELKEI